MLHEMKSVLNWEDTMTTTSLVVQKISISQAWKERNSSTYKSTLCCLFSIAWTEKSVRIRTQINHKFLLIRKSRHWKKFTFEFVRNLTLEKSPLSIWLVICIIDKRHLWSYSIFNYSKTFMQLWIRILNFFNFDLNSKADGMHAFAVIARHTRWSWYLPVRAPLVQGNVGRDNWLYIVIRILSSQFFEFEYSNIR